MSNKHVNHKHGLVGMKGSQPRSPLRKRRNKANHRKNKEVLFKALEEAKLA